MAQSGSDYYATFSSSKAVAFTDAETTVYTITVANSKMTLAEVTSKQVPANTGVLLKSTKATAAYNIISSATALGDNYLYPASKSMSELSNCYFYKLAYNNYSAKTGLGFYWGAANGASFSAKAGGAYLAVPTSQSAAMHFVFEEEEEVATDFNAAENTDEVVKFFEDGQLFIRKNGKVYNAIGQVVK